MKRSHVSSSYGKNDNGAYRPLKKTRIKKESNEKARKNMKKGNRKNIKQETFDTDSLFAIALYNVVTSCECPCKYWELERMT